MPCPEVRRLAPPDAPLHRKLMLEACAFSDKATLFGMYVRPAHREGGIGLYARCGCGCFGTEPMAVKLGESYINKVHMWQRVAPDAPWR